MFPIESEEILMLSYYVNEIDYGLLLVIIIVNCGRMGCYVNCSRPCILLKSGSSVYAKSISRRVHGMNYFMNIN